MPLLFVDFETRSRCDIKRGAYAYAADASTEALCLYIEHESGWRVMWTPREHTGWCPPDGVVYRYGVEWLQVLFSDPENVFVAHNSEFDQCIAEITYRMPQRMWLDTMSLANYLSLPAGLDDLASHLWGVGKDKAGYALMMKLCKPSARMGGEFFPITHDVLTALTIYNIRDVELHRRFWEQHSHKWADFEQGAFQLHQRVNSRGLTLDLEAASGLMELSQSIAGHAGLAVEQATRGQSIGGVNLQLAGTDLTRVQYLQKWFNTIGGHYGWSIDSCDEETLLQMLDAPAEVMPPIARQVAEARLSVSLASVKKLQSALNQVSPDGRLRGQYRYCLAEGTPVLTTTGWKSIETLVAGVDQVWDGVEWVHFAELLDNGVRPCICIDGIWLTPDHQVLDATLGWVEAGDLVSSDYHRPGKVSASGQLLVSPCCDVDQTPATLQAAQSGSYRAVVRVGDMMRSMRGICSAGSQVRALAAEQQPATGSTKTSSRTISSGERGPAGGATWWPGAPISTAQFSNTTVPLAPVSTMRGYPARASSSSIYRHCRVGAKSSAPDWTSIESTREGITGPATCVSSLTGSTTLTDGTASTRSIEGSNSAPASSTGSSLRRAATALSRRWSSADSAGPKSCVGAGSTRVARVYDLRDAGPRHRFQAGQLIAHNCGAHTHRWTGVGVQLQNLPKPSPYLEDEPLHKAERPQAAMMTQLLDACRRRDLGALMQGAANVDAYARAVSHGHASVSVNDVLCSLIRPMFIPAPGHKLIGADFSQIEGRGAAWICGDRRALDAFQANDNGTGPDVYCIAAEAIFGHPVGKKDKKERHVGKQSELSCNYGIGAKMFGERNGAALAAADVTPEYVVGKWRELHRPIVHGWAELERAMRCAVNSSRGSNIHRYACFSFERVSESEVLLHFPTGRAMRYYELRLERDDNEQENRSRLTYDNYRKGEAKVKHLWGGHILENVCQSFCRDLLVEKAEHIEEAGFPIVMHTHDEAVAEVPDDAVADAAEFIRREMATTPAWAAGLPIKGDPAVMVRYNKDA